MDEFYEVRVADSRGEDVMRDDFVNRDRAAGYAAGVRETVDLLQSNSMKVLLVTYTFDPETNFKVIVSTKEII